MENYPPYSSYPDSVHSSPRSRDDAASWEEGNYRVKLVCSYGGKILPRPHDNQLTYAGGDTKILAVERNIKFSSFVSKLTSLCDYEVSFKYQLPGEDLDALISVTNDEDLEHMMLEYDRLCKASAKPARLRLFLFQLNPAGFGSTGSKSESQWFVDALNSVNFEAASPPAAEAAAAEVNNPDYLFGLDKGHVRAEEAVKARDHQAPPVVNAAADKEAYSAREVIGAAEAAVSPAELQLQMEELQRMHISSHEQIPRVYGSNDYPQNAPAPQRTSSPVYWPERNVTSVQYSVPPSEPPPPPVYLIQPSTGVYQAPAAAAAMRQVTGQVGQGYYGMRRVVPEVYREQQAVYNPVGPGAAISQQPRYSGGPYNSDVGVGMRVPPDGAFAAQVSYDGAGRPVYYTAPNPPQGL